MGRVLFTSVISPDFIKQFILNVFSTQRRRSFFVSLSKCKISLNKNLRLNDYQKILVSCVSQDIDIAQHSQKLDTKAWLENLTL